MLPESKLEAYPFNLQDQVNSLLGKRAHLLQEMVYPLAAALNYNVFKEYTCERAHIFFTHHVKPLWQAYLNNKS